MDNMPVNTSEHPTGNVLLLTNKIDESSTGGRELLCKMNHDILRELYADKCIVFELPHNLIRGVKATTNAFRGQIDGLTDVTIRQALQVIRSENVDKVFVDGSNLGAFVKIAKQKFPQIEFCTFFHNVEARFFLGSLKQANTLRALAILMVNYLAERKSVRYSDKIICLSTRDSNLLQRLYGRPATHLSPMALQDQFSKDQACPSSEAREKFALFVGGNFYANRMGITWFVQHVAPHINIKTCIVGRGFENLKSQLEVNEKVEVIGPVDDLAPWYRDAYFVIAPIFDGSGMKTKVAEALMFGKKIIGTPESFSGYEEIADRAGRICPSADKFIVAIESANNIVNNSFDFELREIYEKRYSSPAAKARLESIMVSE